MKQTAREELAAAAAANGWVKDAKQSELIVDFYRKGRRYIWAEFTSLESVNSCGARLGNGKGRRANTDKRNWILEEMAR